MKVLFLGHVPTNGCRTTYYFPLLKKEGIEPHFVGVEPGWREKERDLGGETGWDMIFIQRSVFAPAEMKYLRSRGRGIVYDADDPIMYRSSRHRFSFSLSRRLKFRRMVKSSDIFIAGTSLIAEQAARYLPESRIRKIPSTVDGELYVPHSISPSSTVTLGWLGGAKTLPNLERLRPVLGRIGTAHPSVRLKVVCNRFAPFSVIRTVDKSWAQEEEVADLQSFDVGLLPNPQDRWTRGKGHGKLFQYMAVGIPVVATPVGIVAETVRDGQTGFLCRADDEWFSRLDELIRDPALRARMGSAARADFEQQYSLQAVFPTLRDALHAAV